MPSGIERKENSWEASVGGTSAVTLSHPPANLGNRTGTHLAQPHPQQKLPRSITLISCSATSETEASSSEASRDAGNIPF